MKRLLIYDKHSREKKSDWEAELPRFTSQPHHCGAAGPGCVPTAETTVRTEAWEQKAHSRRTKTAKLCQANDNKCILKT